MDKIKLWRTDDPKVFTEGDYAGDGNGVTLVLTQYSEWPCTGSCEEDCQAGSHMSECDVCGTLIREMDHFVCLDGGDSAHEDCVIIHSTYPHQADSLYDCPACDVKDLSAELEIRLGDG